MRLATKDRMIGSTKRTDTTLRPKDRVMRHLTITLLRFVPLLMTLAIASTCYAQTKAFTMEQELGRHFPAQSTPTCVFSPDGQWVAIVTIGLGSAVISSQ